MGWRRKFHTFWCGGRGMTRNEIEIMDCYSVIDAIGGMIFCNYNMQDIVENLENDAHGWMEIFKTKPNGKNRAYRMYVYSLQAVELIKTKFITIYGVTKDIKGVALCDVSGVDFFDFMIERIQSWKNKDILEHINKG